MDNLIGKLRNEVNNLLNQFTIKDISHDISHLDRVYKMALFIDKKEKLNTNLEVLGISIYFHDLHRIAKKNNYLTNSNDGIELISSIYKKLDLPNNIFEKVIECISSTDKFSFNNSNVVKTNEIKIIQDSDNLDALGAIGIARAFAFGQLINEDMFNNKISLTNLEYNPTKKSPSVIHHFYEKLLKLENEMNTKLAINIAKKRIKFMKSFLKEFFNDWN